MMSYYVYIARNSENKLYIGQTQNLDLRLLRHNHSKGARFTRAAKEDFQLVYSEEQPTLLEAMRREKQLKGWTRAKKEALIDNDLNLLKRL